jgi:transcriptional regulator with XRE-family HTH domain
MKLGERLRRLRDRSGKTQAAVAVEVGVTPRAVQNWEYSKGTLNFEKAIGLAEALGVSLDELAGKAPPPAPKKKDGANLFEKAPKGGRGGKS